MLLPNLLVWGFDNLFGFTQVWCTLSSCPISESSFFGSSTLNHNGFTMFGTIVGKIGMPEFIAVEVLKIVQISATQRYENGFKNKYTFRATKPLELKVN